MNVQEKFDKLMAEINRKAPPLPTVRLKPVRKKTTVFDSKMGGVPYFPKGMEYPTNRDGEPLKFLAQLNFDKLPHIPGFPEKGILQFFAGFEGDDMYGCNLDDNFDTNGFRVIYHENVSKDIAKVSEVEVDDYPFSGEFLLKPEEMKLMNVVKTDHRFDLALIESYNSLFGADINTVYAFDDSEVGLNTVDYELYQAVYDDEDYLDDEDDENDDDDCEDLDDEDEDEDYNEACGTRIGGYALFTQDDPRIKDDEYAACDIMLFQSDSEFGSEIEYEDQIWWGDAGVANFFISSADLAKRDFSHVLYNWDCC